MGNFTLYKNSSSSKKEYEYLLCVQAGLFDDLKSRLVIPLVSKKTLSNPIKILNPEVEIGNRTFVILTQQMAAVPKGLFGEPIQTVKINRTEILSAIDFLITGF